LLPYFEAPFYCAPQQSPSCVTDPQGRRLECSRAKSDTFAGFFASETPCGRRRRGVSFLSQAPGRAHVQEAAVPMTKEEERELREQLARLQQEHRDLDAAISALQHSPGSDLLQVQRLKKRKLVLRDRIFFIEDQLTPDIIA
jgi:hypothetical protein